ncbi:MAG TPA: hypothetical protein VMO26_07160 [Vicinamibacterales bacterium]|nr:hypothetical protein [Vicinamibacterales bacterium]
MLTRRDFLQQFGVVAGSPAVAAAMTSWDLLAQQVGARPTWMGRPTDVRVVVLGAGLSGLAVGYSVRPCVSMFYARVERSGMRGYGC